MAADSLASVPEPSEALYVGEWVDENGHGSFGRHVNSSRRTAAGAAVAIAGWQDDSGEVEWHATVSAPDVEADAAHLRMLAAALLDAADDLDQLAC